MEEKFLEHAIRIGKIWKCTTCDKETDHRGNLRKHILSKHVNSLSFECDQCGKMYTHPHRLKYHKQKRHISSE